MGNNVDVGGVPTATIQVGGFHAQVYAPLGTNAPTVAAVAANATAQTLAAGLAAPTVRRKLLVYNDSNAFLYLKFGTGASLTLFSIAIAPGGAYEEQEPMASGTVTGIWGTPAGGAALAGNALVTEWTTTGTS